jgi:hypothetical protein
MKQVQVLVEKKSVVYHPKNQTKVLDGEYEFTIPHFFEEMAEDDLDFSVSRTPFSRAE